MRISTTILIVVILALAASASPEGLRGKPHELRRDLLLEAPNGVIPECVEDVSDEEECYDLELEDADTMYLFDLKGAPDKDCPASCDCCRIALELFESNKEEDN